MRVYWTREARVRLQEIHAYITKDSPQGAKKVVERLLHRSQQLTRLPMSGRRVPEYPEADLREVLERPFRIIYRVTTKQVEIVTIMHYRQLLPVDLRELEKR